MPNLPPGKSIIYRVGVCAPLWTLLDYVSDCELAAGTVVHVPLGRRTVIGVIISMADASEHGQLKAISRVLPLRPIPSDVRELLQWCWCYYHHPPGEVIAAALPPTPAGPAYAPPTHYAITAAGAACEAECFKRAPRQWEVLHALQQAPRSADELAALNSAWRNAIKRLLQLGLVHTIEAVRPGTSAAIKGPPLRPEQQTAVDAIHTSAGRYEAWLLEGVTGSGKTEVYLRAARHFLDQGQQVLLLVPEIGLTPQTLQRVRERLGCEVGQYHSGMTDTGRRHTWQRVADSDLQVIVGTRSAVFLPFTQLGFIAVDEEHDASYKQQEGFHYSARDIAVMRAHRLNIPVVLGSATPALESLANARRERYRTLRLKERSGGECSWQLIDMRGLRRQALAPPVQQAIKTALDAGGQVMIFRNRRGYAPVLMCASCGWSADCHRCSAHFTWHRRVQRLICHHCGIERSRPKSCPSCHGEELIELGLGTERLEEELQAVYPNTPVYRVDRDKMRGRDAMSQLRDTILNGEPCLLVGTQMLAKGHDFPGLELVVVVDADQALHSADFHAPERLGQLLIQVAGRAGRGERPGRVMIQTLQPEHPLLARLIADGYPALASDLLAERQAAQLPPFSAHAMIRANATKQHLPGEFLRAAAELRQTLPNSLTQGIDCLGPFPALMEQRAGRWRWQLWLQAAERPRLNAFLKHWLHTVRQLPLARQVRWTVDVDPYEL